MPPRKKGNDLSEMLSTLTSGLERVALRPDANGYQPHEKQKPFHESGAKGRLYIGGNRSGKTVAGIVEDIWWLTGKHPHRKTPEGGIRGRLVCVDFPNGWSKIIKPVLTQWIPPSVLIDGSWTASWAEREKKLTLENGSFLEIMSYDQELEAFAGASRHFTHFDEEPPKEIWTECRARLVDTGGSWWITMTPVEGMTWVFDDIYEPAMEGRSNYFVIEVDMTDNTYLSPVEIEEFLEGLDEDEIKARKQGKFVQMGGLIFKDFNPEVHVIPALQMPVQELVTRSGGTLRISSSMDHGLNHPTAFTWHLVTSENEVITFAEHYKSEWTVAQHANRIHEIEEKLGISGLRQVYWADPSVRQRNAVTRTSIQQEYRKLGVNLVPSNNDVKIGINRMVNYQRQGKWFITTDCPNLAREMRRYRWKTRQSKKLQAIHGSYDEPHKKDDDAVDSARYFFVSLPELAPKPKQIEDLTLANQTITSMLNAKQMANIFTGRRDTRLFKPSKLGSEFKLPTDEHMGGEW